MGKNMQLKTERNLESSCQNQIDSKLSRPRN
jgi:hypothetical protein